MKANLDCIPCFQRQALKAARMNVQDARLQEEILRNVMRCLLKLDWSKTPPELGDQVHRIVRAQIGIDDPYKDAKKKCNDIALELLPNMRKKVDESSDPLETAIRISVAGNIMDFGPSGGNFNVERTLEEVLEKNLP